MDSGRLPTVALVGRPNVGKSTLFNRLIGRRRSIVHDLPGVTRDRVAGEGDWDGRRFEVSDTGGVDPDAVDVMTAQVGDAALRAATRADVIVVLVDGRSGLLPLDAQVVQALRRMGAQRVVLAVNKIDSNRAESAATEFAKLGLGTPIAISAEHGLGINTLLDAIVDHLPEVGEELPPEPEPSVRIALIGRPNVGKSTLFNQLVGDERSIVSEMPGTTRDTVDIVVVQDGRRICFVDTAGIRRKGKTERGPEVLSVVMARKTIERADVVGMVIDASQPIAHQDAAVAGLADEAGRASVVVLNKADLVATQRRNEIEAELRSKLKFLAYAPRVWLSGMTGAGLHRLAPALIEVGAAGQIRVGTGELNRFVERVLTDVSLKASHGQDARILYATQTGIRPPTFTFFVTRQIEPHFSTVRFITNRLRKEYGFIGTPLRIRFRQRTRRRER